MARQPWEMAEVMFVSDSDGDQQMPETPPASEWRLLPTEISEELNGGAQTFSLYLRSVGGYIHFGFMGDLDDGIRTFAGHEGMEILVRPAPPRMVLHLTFRVHRNGLFELLARSLAGQLMWQHFLTSTLCVYTAEMYVERDLRARNVLAHNQCVCFFSKGELLSEFLTIWPEKIACLPTNRLSRKSDLRASWLLAHVDAE